MKPLPFQGGAAEPGKVFLCPEVDISRKLWYSGNVVIMSPTPHLLAEKEILMKRAVSLILALALVLSLAPVTAQAASPAYGNEVWLQDTVLH